MRDKETDGQRERERERERETNRDSETQRRTDRQTGRQADTDRQRQDSPLNYGTGVCWVQYPVQEPIPFSPNFNIQR